MKTLTIKIKNNKALKLLRDLEDLSIIQIVKDQSDQAYSIAKKDEAIVGSQNIEAEVDDSLEIVSSNLERKLLSNDLYETSIERLLAASDDDDYTNISVLENNPLYKNDKTR